MRGYIDRLIEALYRTATNTPKQNGEVQQAWYRNRRMLQYYQGKEGFMRLMENQMLEEFLDTAGEPRIVFEGIHSHENRLPN